MGCIIINTEPQGYNIKQVPRTMTVRELVEMLEDYEDDTPVYLGFDNHYTYGGIQENMLEERDSTEEEDE